MALAFSGGKQYATSDIAWPARPGDRKSGGGSRFKMCLHGDYPLTPTLPQASLRVRESSSESSTQARYFSPSHASIGCGSQLLRRSDLMYASQKTGSIKRREFLAGASLAATLSVVGPAVALGSRANSVLRLGMIGCGGRGTWIADLFARTGQYQFVACADYFPDRARAFGERFKIEPGRQFTTLSGYKRLLDEPLDAVVIESPPYFHPEQAAAAVDAGKHVYLAKPMAVDVPGCLTIAEAGKKATRQETRLPHRLPDPGQRSLHRDPAPGTPG